MDETSSWVLKLDKQVRSYIENSLSASGTHDEETSASSNLPDTGTCSETLLKTLALPPAFTTLRVNTLTISCDEAQEKVQEELKSRNNGDGDPLSVHRHETVSDVLVIPHTGPHAIERVEKEVIVDLACGMAVLRGAPVFAQGIMSAHPALQVGDTVSVYSDVNGLCRKGAMKPFDQEKLFVGNGESHVSRHDLFGHQSKPSGLGIEMTQRIFTAPSLSGLLPELVFPQNLPSILCAHILDPQPGELVMDMCAAPGGKTSHIGMLMKNEGRLIAIDKSKPKIPKIEENLAKAGVTIAEVYNLDANKSVLIDADVAGPPPFPPDVFDRILVDAPCSALGQRPQLRNKMLFRAVISYPKVQFRLLCAAVDLLKPGGVLVYSTCTIPSEENEIQVAKMLNKFPQLQLVSQTPYHLGREGLPGSVLSDGRRKLVQRFLPDSTRDDLQNVNNDTIGFFIAKFVKRI